MTLHFQLDCYAEAYLEPSRTSIDGTFLGNNF